MEAHTLSTFLTIGHAADGSGGTNVPVLPGATVTEDETWCPNISAEVLVPIEYAVDARTSPRALLEFYLYNPSGQGSTRSGVWDLLVRKCVVNYRAGTARLILESPDVLLLGTAMEPTGVGLMDNLEDALDRVYAQVDPSGVRLGPYSIAGDVSTTRLGLLIGDDDPALHWTPPASGVDFLTGVANIYRARFRTRRDGTIVAYRTWNEGTSRLVQDNSMLDIEYATDAAEFYNTAVVFRETELGNEFVARRVIQSGTLKPAAIGRRTWFQWAPRADSARMDRALSQGRTWQVTTMLDPTWQAGDLVRVFSNAYGLDFTERAPVVRHTSDGQTILNILPPEIGEDVTP